MLLEIDVVNHGCFLFTMLSSQTDYHLGKDAFFAPPFPTVVEGLVRAIVFEHVSPLQAIAIAEDNATQDVPVINA